VQPWRIAKPALLLGCCVRFATSLAAADFVPIPLATGSFNHDVVVEKTAPAPLVPVTSASMQTGTNNTGLSWYERGYNADFPSTGLPAPGAVVVGDLTPDHQYLFAPNYKTNNAFLLDSNLTSATVLPVVPATFARLSFLAAGANGPGPLQYTVHHQSGANESGSFACPDWYLGAGAAVTAYGSVDVRQFTFDGINTPHPSLFLRDISLTNTSSPVTSVAISSSSGEIVVFALSGSTNLADDFLPIAIKGYNADVIVEAAATRRIPINGATTATIEHGAVNAGNTWYEQTYYAPLAASGLPLAGSNLTNAAGDHRFVMPTSFSANNALVLDPDSPSGSLTPFAPASCAALSFLAAAGHGPVTNGCIIQHADGISETNSFIVPDWMSGGSAAWIPNGRVNIDNRVVDASSGSPRLFSLDVVVAHSTSPVTNVSLTFDGGPPDSRSVVFALSGSASAGGGPRPLLTIDRLAGGNLRINSSQPGLLEATTSPKMSNTVWQTIGAISSNVVLSPTTNGPVKFFRVKQ